MCGIAGIAGRADEALVRRMADAIAHRGPDDAGVYTAPGISLGHRRLSIIDIEGGHQPMAGFDGAHWLVYNGEIYNFLELRRTLAQAGYPFQTQCDTEVVLAAYRHYGDDCVRHFRGMFAFALWDAPQQRLLLARDPVGIKPLYYAMRNGVLFFSSEIPALLEASGVRRELDPEGLDDYLTYLYTMPPRTLFKDIRQLPPATYAAWRHGQWEEKRYWTPEPKTEYRSESEWIDAANACIQDSIEQHLVSDVPLGAFLSGGLDSAAIVQTMAAGAPEPVHTFTMGFGTEGRWYDETAYAETLARRFRTEHRALQIEAGAANLLPTIVRHFGEPFGNPTALLYYRLSAETRRHVKVVLSGDGGDESFGGYPRHAAVRLSEYYRRLPESLRRYLLNPLIQWLPESTQGLHGLRRLRQFSAGSLLDPVDMYASWVTYFSEEERRELYGAGLPKDLAGRDAHAPLRAHFNQWPETDLLSRALYTDLMTFLPHNVLQYGDRMSMAHGLETRVPFADTQVIELLARVPSTLKVRGLQTKYLMRRCLAGVLPPDALRRKKMGFSPPLGMWLNTELRPLVDEYLSEATLRDRGYFEPQPVQRMIRGHRASRRDYSMHLWALLLFEQWHRQYLD